MGSRSRLEPPSSSKAAITEEEDGPTVTHSESSPSRVGGSWKKMPQRKDKGAERDTALALFNDPNELYEPVDPAEARRLLWKIDFMILPYLAVCYAFFYIDKVVGIFPFASSTETNWLMFLFFADNAQLCSDLWHRRGSRSSWHTV